MNFIGISIGVFVGIISGIIALAIMRALSTASIGHAGSVKMLSIQLLSVVTLVAGASFLMQSNLFPQKTVKDIRSFAAPKTAHFGR